MEISRVANTQSNYCTHICCCGIPVRLVDLFTSKRAVLGPDPHDTELGFSRFYINTLSSCDVFPSEPPTDEICEVKVGSPCGPLQETKGKGSTEAEIKRPPMTNRRMCCHNKLCSV